MCECASWCVIHTVSSVEGVHISISWPYDCATRVAEEELSTAKENHAAREREQEREEQITVVMEPGIMLREGAKRGGGNV